MDRAIHEEYEWLLLASLENTCIHLPDRTIMSTVVDNKKRRNKRISFGKKKGSERNIEYTKSPHQHKLQKNNKKGPVSSPGAFSSIDTLFGFELYVA